MWIAISHCYCAFVLRIKLVCNDSVQVMLMLIFFSSFRRIKQKREMRMATLLRLLSARTSFYVSYHVMNTAFHIELVERFRNMPVNYCVSLGSVNQ